MKGLIKKSTAFVVKNAEFVNIREDKIKRLAKKWAGTKLPVPPWPYAMHFDTDDERTMLDYLIILDTLNFCFWSRSKRWSTSHKGKKYTGYFALSLALKKFFDTYPGKANLSYFSAISQSEFREMLDGRGKLLLIEDRWIALRKVSLRILNQYEGDSRKFIRSANQRSSVLIKKIATELYSYNDIAYYKKNKIYFFKRAQILIADIIAAFEGRGLGKFIDADTLTVFADYKLPQLMHHLGILEYKEPLLSKIKKKRRIYEGSKEEIEIRSATIQAAEILKEELRKKRKKLFAYELDWILWKKSQSTKMKYPHHFTETIFY